MAIISAVSLSYLSLIIKYIRHEQLSMRSYLLLYRKSQPSRYHQLGLNERARYYRLE